MWRKGWDVVLELVVGLLRVHSIGIFRQNVQSLIDLFPNANHPKCRNAKTAKVPSLNCGL